MKQKRKKKQKSGTLKQNNKKQSVKAKRDNKKRPRTFKWYLDKILMFVMGLLVITGIVLWAVGGENDSILMYIGIAMLPLTGILITPNIVLYAIKDSKDQKSSEIEKEKSKLYKEEYFYRVNMPPEYHSKLIFGVIREALWNLFKLMIAVGVLLILFLDGFGGIESSDQIGTFFIIIGLMVGGIPVIAYNITISVCRIRTVVKHEYQAYHSIVGGVDALDMWMMGETNKREIYQFHYCRCLGISKRKINNTEVILAFVPDEVYLLPFKEGNSKKNLKTSTEREKWKEE